jgi:hypothetical protein
MLPGAPSCGSNVFTYYVKFRESFYVLRKTHPKVFTFYVKFAQSFCRSARGTSLARRARRGAIDLAFARRLPAWARHSAISVLRKTVGNFLRSVENACLPSAGRGGRGFLPDFAGLFRENSPRIFRRCRFADDPSRTRVRERSVAERQNGKEAGWFSRRRNPEEILFSRLSAVSALFVFLLLAPLPAAAGWVERTPSNVVLNLTLFNLPDPSRTDPSTRAELAVQREFLRVAPDLLRARQAAAPGRYGELDLSRLDLRLHRFSGIQVEGVESTLLAIAGNVAPDVLYVNFRQSDTYIQQGFLHPMDLPEDGYFSALAPEEVARRLHPKIEPVVRRKGPDGATHVWALPGGPPLGRVVLYRRDLFDAAGVPPPRPDWTWADFYDACRKVADPARGIYGLGLSRGKDESYLWMPFLWGAGGDALAFDESENRWRAVFDTPQPPMPSISTSASPPNPGPTPPASRAAATS